MIKGAPLLRRSFLDAAISQLKPAYLAALSDYAAVLKQRNALLKNEAQDERSRMPLLCDTEGVLAVPFGPVRDNMAGKDLALLLFFN